MKNNNLIECGVSFIVALFSYLIIGPIIYALIYPYINGTLLSYASLFIPSLFTLLVLVILKRKRLIDDFRASRDRGFSLPLFFIFLSSSFIFLSLTSLLEGAKVNPAPMREKILSLFISLLFIPIQITIEEYIFRILPYKAVEEEKMLLVKNGVVLVIDEEKATEMLKKDKVTLICDMKEGEASATAWGCDLTHEYVTINGDYRS